MMPHHLLFTPIIFYDDRPFPDAYRLEGRPCVIADLALTSPAYALDNLNAYDRPGVAALFRAGIRHPNGGAGGPVGRRVGGQGRRGREAVLIVAGQDRTVIR